MDKSSIMVDMVEESNKENEANQGPTYPHQVSGGQFSAAPYPSGPISPPAVMQGANMQPPPYHQTAYNQSQTGNMIPAVGSDGTPMVINVQGVNKAGPPMVWKNLPVVTPAGNPAVWEKVSVRTLCTNCSADQFTRVDSRVSSNGKTWAILCFCFGSWLLSLLVLCMDGFKEYLHFCSSCHAQLGVYMPKMSGGMKVLLALLTLAMLAVQVVVVIFYVVPLMQGSNNSYRHNWG